MPGLSPYGLTCEFLDRPLGVDKPAPRLTWKFRSGTMGDGQTGYRLTVRAAREPVWETTGDGDRQAAYEGRRYGPRPATTGRSRSATRGARRRAARRRGYRPG
ncbi:hypothetical protein [Nonomuraea basaltis]|uniref:glycoside hydrolase family 78 protein n=1 Tax=Nonomuraea basaltis TaxID=2495887 RepID=UPI00110C51DB|nr:hypothetical protein [Nonomuraea basaltis]TMR97896.1 hypothetical protein EJK15_15430 [Nonomuraea basaltis]